MNMRNALPVAIQAVLGKMQSILIPLRTMQMQLQYALFVAWPGVMSAIRRTVHNACAAQRKSLRYWFTELHGRYA